MGIANTQERQKVIVGLGQTGLSCAKYLYSKQESFKVVDTRQEPPGLEELIQTCPNVKVELGDFQLNSFINAEELIVSPGVDLRIPVIQESIAAGVVVSGDIDIFAKQIEAPIIAITGSNAKSTVVTLVGEMAKQAGINVAVAGNIGKPVLDLLLEQDYDLYVLELSSFQLETTNNLGANVATVLNMSPDHLDRYDSMQAYHQAKHRVFQGCERIVINRDDALSKPLLPESVKQSSFGLTTFNNKNEFGLVNIDGEEFLALDNVPLLPVKELKIKGQHNISNALAALAVANAAGIQIEPMLDALKNFEGLPHRCQWVAQKNGITFYNDSKGTNVGACIAAIEGLGEEGKLILIAGGVGKEANFSELSEPIAKYGKLLVLFGKDASAIEKVLRKHVRIILVGSLAEAVETANAKAESGDTVLMSPACASFDMFDNYMQRGNEFMDAVKEVH